MADQIPSSSSPTPNCNVREIQEDSKRLIRTLVWIRAKLDDAENMEITDHSVRHWLRELQGVASDAEDVLDEFPCEAMRLGLMEDRGLTPRSPMEDFVDAVVHKIEEAVNIPGKGVDTWGTGLQVCHPSSPTLSHEIFAFLYDVKQRIEMINTRFDEITNHKQALWIEEDSGRRRVQMSARQPTGSLVEEPCIFGRDEDLETVKKFLLSDDESRGSNNVPMMAIVGMGGLGKTTLARLAYNDDVIVKHFQLKFWVCVSEDFDVVWLTKAMVESLNPEACGISMLDTLQVKVKEKLAGRRFLLVLDDVWEVQDLSSKWDRLTAPLRYGSAGSKIIITTRSNKVSQMTRATSTYNLPCLKDEDCLRLFYQRAIEGWNPDLCPNLMANGEKSSGSAKVYL